MSTGHSHVEFLEFLDWLGAKGLLPANTAHARKAVANKVLEALDPAELEDITKLDIDEVMLRFTNKFGKRYTPESLRTYRSRFETSVADFISYCDNPVGFKLSGRVRPTTPATEKSDNIPAKRPVIGRRISPITNSSSDVADSPRTSPSSVVPIQIRENLVISVGPVPFDFSAAEARRVANVILALAASD